MTSVIHQPDQNRFICTIDGAQAVLEYQLLPGNNIDFSRTFVPDEARGKGIAEALVRQGLQWAKDQGYSIQASCWYVDKFLGRSKG